MNRRLQRNFIGAGALARGYFVVLIALFSLSNSPKVHAVEGNDAKILTRILDAGRELGNENTSVLAVARLRELSRTDVVMALTPVIEAGAKGGQAESELLIALDVSKALELKELMPLLLKHAKSTQVWRVLETTNFLADEANSRQLEEIYLQRLSAKAPAAAKQAMLKSLALDGLAKVQAKLPRDVFERALDDRSFEVRESAVGAFLRAREKYSTDDQVARFRRVFVLKPYQARLMAMRHFAAIPAPERTRLKAAVSKRLCEGEKNVSVKQACAELLRGVP